MDFLISIVMCVVFLVLKFYGYIPSEEVQDYVPKSEHIIGLNPNNIKESNVFMYYVKYIRRLSNAKS